MDDYQILSQVGGVSSKETPIHDSHSNCALNRYYSLRIRPY